MHRPIKRCFLLSGWVGALERQRKKYKKVNKGGGVICVATRHRDGGGGVQEATNLSPTGSFEEG